MSRPEKKIDWKRVERMLEAGCSGAEIAPHFDLHVNTFYDRVASHYGVGFTDVQQAIRSVGDSNLRKQQYEEALGIAQNKGNTQLLLRLGEGRLGQKNESTDGSQTRAFVSLIQRLEKAESELLKRGSNQSVLETSESVLHQRPGGEKDNLSPELGAERNPLQSPLL